MILQLAMEAKIYPILQQETRVEINEVEKCKVENKKLYEVFEGFLEEEEMPRKVNMVAEDMAYNKVEGIAAEEHRDTGTE